MMSFAPDAKYFAFGCEEEKTCLLLVENGGIET